MGRCRFNLDLSVYGLPINKYDTIRLGDKYAKIIDVREDDKEYKIILESRHKNRDFFMTIETIWTLIKGNKTFRVYKAFLDIKIFDITSEVYAIPESHFNTLKKWYKEMH
jgi:hypothetical protein